VLELGCGPGHLLQELNEAGYDAIGIDRSPAMWKRAHITLSRAGRLQAVIAADARALPFADRSFDSIVMTFPTPVVRNPELWRESARVLRPGGRLVIVLGARRSPLRPAPSSTKGERGGEVGGLDEDSRDDSRSIERTSVEIPTELFRWRWLSETSSAGTVELIVAERLEDR
jgi:SAM-dependent methyltransferase